MKIPEAFQVAGARRSPILGSITLWVLGLRRRSFSVGVRSAATRISDEAPIFCIERTTSNELPSFNT